MVVEEEEEEEEMEIVIGGVVQNSLIIIFNKTINNKMETTNFNKIRAKAGTKSKKTLQSIIFLKFKTKIFQSQFFEKLKLIFKKLFINIFEF